MPEGDDHRAVEVISHGIHRGVVEDALNVQARHPRSHSCGCQQTAKLGGKRFLSRCHFSDLHRKLVGEADR